MVTLSTSAVNGGAADFAHSPHCRDHLRPFLKWLLRRHRKFGGVTEIRAIAEAPAKMVWSGYFDPQHVKALVEQITPEEDAHVADASGDRPQQAKGWGWRRQDARWEPRGDRVGWIQGHDLFLEPEAAFAVAQRLAQESGEALTIGSRTLHKRLQEQDWLVSTDPNRQRLTVRRTLEGKVRQVLFLRAKVLTQG